MNSKENVSNKKHHHHHDRHHKIDEHDAKNHAKAIDAEKHKMDKDLAKIEEGKAHLVEHVAPKLEAKIVQQGGLPHIIPADVAATLVEPIKVDEREVRKHAKQIDNEKKDLDRAVEKLETGKAHLVEKESKKLDKLIEKEGGFHPNEYAK